MTNRQNLPLPIMTILIICLLFAVFVATFWLLYRILYVKQKSRKLSDQKFKIFESVIRRLTMRENISPTELIKLAENPSTRHALFGILEAFGRVELFPKDYYTLEKSAESFMVTWLEFPTELNAPPDNIELFTRILLGGDEALEYFVFRYRKIAPPAGLSGGWMMGIAGPFGPFSKPYEIPMRIFSRFNEVGTVSALEEVRWVHEHINRS